MSRELRDALHKIREMQEVDGAPVIYLHNDEYSKPFGALLTIDALKYLRCKDIGDYVPGKEPEEWDPMDHSHLEGTEDEYERDQTSTT